MNVVFVLFDVELLTRHVVGIGLVLVIYSLSFDLMEILTSLSVSVSSLPLIVNVLLDSEEWSVVVALRAICTSILPLDNMLYLLVVMCVHICRVRFINRLVKP